MPYRLVSPDRKLYLVDNEEDLKAVGKLYGLTSNASTKQIFGEPQNQPLEKLADISNFVPGTAANKFYDKHIIQALDRFT